MISSGAITFGVAVVSAIVCFFGLLLALNGFMGQERAVNALIVTYVVLALLVIALMTLFSALTANFLQKRFNWQAAVAVMASSLGFAVIVADQMRTKR